MRDTLISGSVAGIIGGAIGAIFSHTLFLLGITPISSVHLAATLVVTDIMNLTVGGVIWSLVTHLLIAAVFGSILILVLLHTGTDYWIPKGIAVGAVFCLLTHSYLIPLVRTDLDLTPSALATGAMLTTHSLIGLVTAFVLVRYAVRTRV